MREFRVVDCRGVTVQQETLVQAATPEAAAASVLGEEVYRSGAVRNLRARVYFQTEDKALTMVRLYSKALDISPANPPRPIWDASMPVAPPYEFSLQLFENLPDGALYLQPAVMRITALSPEDAANKLVGETLVSSGSPRDVRAKVWRVGAPGVLTTMLYKREDHAG